MVPRPSETPTAEECQKHFEAITELAESLMDYLGTWDIANLVEELAKLYKEAHTDENAIVLDEPDSRLLMYNDEDELTFFFLYQPNNRA